jgi:signal transduction histidine kinase
LDDLGLGAAVRGLISDLTEADGIDAKLHVVGKARRLMPEEELTLFRIAQEALHNARRHSGASRVEIKLEFHLDNVRMTIKDNGRGFDAPRRTDELVTLGKLGLIGMDERARALGGTLTIQSKLGQGTTIVVAVPVQLQ